MNNKEIKDTNLIINIVGIDEAKKILTNWVYNDTSQIESLDTAEFGLIAAFTKWTYIAEANYESINSFLGYILMKSKIHNDKRKYKKKHKQKEEETITTTIKKFTEIYDNTRLN